MKVMEKEKNNLVRFYFCSSQKKEKSISFTFCKIKDDFELENIALWLMQYASFPLEIIKTFGLDLSNDTFKDKELSKSGKILKGVQTLYFSFFYINCSSDWSSSLVLSYSSTNKPKCVLFASSEKRGWHCQYSF